MHAMQTKNTFTLGLLVGLVDLFLHLSFKLATAVSTENIVVSFYTNLGDKETIK